MDELPTAEITIWKDGRAVATADSMRTAILHDVDEVIVKDLQLFFFSTIKLSPPVVFEHLSGRSLGAFLEKCGIELKVDGRVMERHEPLRYVHGRTEAMKGKHRVSSVLLAKPLSDMPDEPTWLANLPTIYTKFLSL